MGLLVDREAVVRRHHQLLGDARVVQEAEDPLLNFGVEDELAQLRARGARFTVLVAWLRVFVLLGHDRPPAFGRDTLHAAKARALSGRAVVGRRDKRPAAHGSTDSRCERPD